MIDVVVFGLIVKTQILCKVLFIIISYQFSLFHLSRGLSELFFINWATTSYPNNQTINQQQSQLLHYHSIQYNCSNNLLLIKIIQQHTITLQPLITIKLLFVTTTNRNGFIKIQFLTQQLHFKLPTSRQSNNNHFITKLNQTTILFQPTIKHYNS